VQCPEEYRPKSLLLSRVPDIAPSVIANSMHTLVRVQRCGASRRCRSWRKEIEVDPAKVKKAAAVNPAAANREAAAAVVEAAVVPAGAAAVVAAAQVAVVAGAAVQVAAAIARL